MFIRLGFSSNGTAVYFIDEIGGHGKNRKNSDAVGPVIVKAGLSIKQRVSTIASRRK